ncbi:MAG TPA: N-acetylneuraminate synthase [Phycisphaerales bacterium]|nr:N-acetylneuraminate synthase [Phycisphaerales bacterium]
MTSDAAHSPRDMPFGSADPFVIAEIGVNHDGDPARAEALVDAASEAGADAVKFQWFEPRRLLSRSARLAAYQAASGEQEPIAMLERLRLDPDGLERARARAVEHGLHTVVTVFSPELVEPADLLDWDHYKTASPDIVNRPLLEALASTGSPLIISTGGATLPEVRRALEWIEGVRPTLLHCVSSYPTPLDSASLGGIDALSSEFGLTVGYSDHTVSIHAGGLAVAAGARVLEKHLTWSRDADGPDHSASIDPDGFARYVRFARESRLMMGAPGKRPLPVECDVMTSSRQSVAILRDIPEGHVIAAGDLTTMRPGTGVPAASLSRFIGCRAMRPLEGGTLLDPESVQSPEAMS